LVTGTRYDQFGNVINSYNYTQVGVLLNVTPFITKDGLVEMIVSPQISSIDPTLSIPISAGATAPVIDERSASTVAVTPDGETVIIGGLMEDDKTVNVIKIPFLGDIPVLGNLFRRTQKSTAKTELIIFLTPHIAQAPSELVALSAEEKKKSDGPQAFTEKELNRFLQSLPPPKRDPKASGKEAPKALPKGAVLRGRLEFGPRPPNAVPPPSPPAENNPAKPAPAADNNAGKPAAAPSQ